MSMQNWLHDAQPFPSSDNGSFNANGDPSMAFMQTPTTSAFDFNQIPNPQLQQQRVQNGGVRNGSPAYNNPVYQTQPMIPSKRPRPREDSVGASPQQHPGTLPTSRSQTPHGQYPGFQGAVNGGQQFSGPALYQQFPQAGNHASPSPVAQTQAFNPQIQHQRVQTMSPSPFSPANQSFAQQASPSQSENGSRVNTPPNGTQHYAQGVSYSGTPNQPFTPPVGSHVNGTGLPQYNQNLQSQHQQQQLRMNEMRMRQLQQQAQGSPANPLPQSSNHMSAPHLAALRAQQVQQAQQRSNNPEALLRTLQQWAGQHGQQFNQHPMIAGRAVSGVQLFSMVMRLGGSKRVTASGNWPNVATYLQFQGQQQMIAAQELQNYWQASLAGYEHLFGLREQQRRAVSQGQIGELTSKPGAFSPIRQIQNRPQQQLMQPPSHMQAPFQTPTKHINSEQNDLRQPLQNGFITAQQGQGQGQTSNNYNIPQPIPAPSRAVAPIEVQRAPASRTLREKKSPKKDPWPAKSILGSEFIPVVDTQGETARTWGGIELGAFVGTVEDLLKYKLSVPKIEELGLIDIRALTLSLQSGLHAEVRFALDTLASLSKEYSGLILENCEDLLDTLIDCADDQVQLLAENSPEVSDEMLINSYEETIRCCKVENTTLQDVPEFGALDYDLDRAVDRLICITTIMRNMSISEANQVAIADPIVVRFMATIIRYIGTRSMLLRTHRNVLDFSKDILTILANVSQFIDLPGKEEALCILHFLLAFAPSPAPNNNEEEGVAFASYLPGVHRYYPLAVDSMAKLLARGDPNRTFYRLIFAADTISSPPSDLLTRSFGLAIAAIPGIGNLNPGSLIKVRLPYLLQGLLAAEILASLIPSTEHDLARSWLASQDSFALSLMKIVTELIQQPSLSLQRHHPGRAPDPDPFGYVTVMERGFAVLRKLTEKVQDAGASSKELPVGLLPNKQSVLAAMKMNGLAPNVARQLCALSNLDN